MEEKYKKAIMAGITCGIILVILTIASIIVEQFIFGSQLQDMAMKYSDPNYIPPADLSDIINAVVIMASVSLLVLLVRGALTFCGAGIIAVKMASPFIKDRNDVLMSGVIAGTVAEFVHRPFSMVISFIADLVHPSGVDPASGSIIVQAIINLVAGLVCAFPVKVHRAGGAWVRAVALVKDAEAGP